MSNKNFILNVFKSWGMNVDEDSLEESEIAAEEIESVMSADISAKMSPVDELEESF